MTVPALREFALPVPIARAILHPFFRFTMHPRVPWRVQRAVLDAGSVLQQSPPGTRVQRLRLGGRPAERVTSDRPAAAGAVLYLHGGGYTIGSPATHRSLAAHLARDLRRPVYLPDYRLAPEHPYPAALDDAEAAFLELLGSGFAPENLVVAGDSAGGGLALALAERLRDEHGIRPAALGLIAPWADPNEKPPRARDLVINSAWSRAAAAAYRAGGSGLEVGYAPLLGRLDGLPPVYVQADTGELLYGQCTRLVAGLRAAGVPVRFSVTSGLWHVAQLQAALVAPAASELREMSGFLGQALKPAAA
ncbi:alpha/beta hydrolase fold domain-containing protein [Nocardia aurantia]|uniref:Putative acetyl-hydrolase LipR n=1 Tax=Nocardia aurantia TaxID=2585199 RepID=A0A7K0DS83_9NOCA|nr:alpha/beta hydrolase fold domain-containing protein [Nocardia aurantia]MQY28630.1 putative acetyl-hydrolase LipR [Nocardia aurantia]